MARTKSKVIMTPTGTADKPRILRQLQGSIYFEKHLAASAAAPQKGSSWTVTLPASFVRDHGDKFRKSVKLRTESSTRRWPVNLNAWSFSQNCSQVRFEGGWRAFAHSNGLKQGDVLIFELMAMSDFKVYIFRGTDGPQKSPSPKHRKRIRDLDCPLTKAKKPNEECRDERLGGGEKKRAERGSNGRMNVKMKSGNSAFSPGPVTPAGSRGSSDPFPSFFKTLTVTNVRQDCAGKLEFPARFWRMQGHRIHSAVQLQGIQEHSPLRNMACFTTYGQSLRHHLKAGWQAFVAENHLHAGQQLLFTLAADSVFIVRDRSACNWA